MLKKLVNRREWWSRSEIRKRNKQLKIRFRIAIKRNRKNRGRLSPEQRVDRREQRQI